MGWWAANNEDRMRDQTTSSIEGLTVSRSTADPGYQQNKGVEGQRDQLMGKCHEGEVAGAEKLNR